MSAFEFGREKAEKYGKQITSVLSGKAVSKKKGQSRTAWWADLRSETPRDRYVGFA